MFRSFILAFVVAGCSSFQAPSTQSPSGASPRQPVAGDEVHRGLLTNQKSSPDSGQASEGGGGRSGGGI